MLADALEALANSMFEVVLLDLNLPDSEGLETLGRVREVSPEVAVVVVTATESEEIGMRAVKMGAQDFLVKGAFNETTLQRTLLYSIERHRMQRTIQKLAIMDELTGLYNRRGFNSLQQHVLTEGLETDARGFMCYFDLDDFKNINDELGHQRGDEALVEFAAALRSVFRQETLLARMGGDEFVAMGVQTFPGQVDRALEGLQNLLAERNQSDDADYELETSCGVTIFGRDKRFTIDELIETADNALYQNKDRRKRVRARQRSGKLRASA
jgi:diguanylate cyclase (GGDEF)-like protein